MATEQQLIEGIRRADAAGDSAGVQVLGKQLLAMRSAPKVAQVDKPTSFWQGVGDEAQRITDRIPDPIQAISHALGFKAPGDTNRAKMGATMRQASANAPTRPSAWGRLATDIGVTALIPGGPIAAGAIGGGVLSDSKTLGGTAKDMAFGAVAGKAGDMAGRFVAKGVGRVLAPKLAQKLPVAGDDYKSSLQLLANEGVDIMPGQAIGQTGKRLEEKAMSMPLLGDAIRARSGKQLEQFNRAGINRALSPLGAKLPKGVSGQDAMRFMQGHFDDAYDAARSGMVFQADNAFNANVDNLLASAAENPLLKQEQVQALNGVIGNLRTRGLANGEPMTGDVFKKTVSQLKAQASKAMGGNNPADMQELGKYLSELVDHIDEAARANPATNPAAAALMDKADEGYAMAVRLENAARQRGGETGMFTANQLDSAVQKADKTARNRAYLRGDALMQDLATAGKQVLAPKVPNSGTADRLLVNAGTMGPLGMFSPASLAAYGSILPAYIPGLLTKRPGWSIGAGKAASKLAAPLGILGTGAAVAGTRK